MSDLEKGFFLDPGASYFLPRLKNNPALGLYLALTGHKIKGKEAVAYGVATHYVESRWLGEFKKTLAKQVENPNAHDPQVHVERDLEPFETRASVDEFEENDDPTIEYLDDINELFTLEGSIYDFYDRLNKSESFIAEWTLGLLENKNPLALVLTYELLKRGKDLPLM